MTDGSGGSDALGYGVSLSLAVLTVKTCDRLAAWRLLGPKAARKLMHVGRLLLCIASLL